MNTLFELASYLQNNDDYVLVGHERPDHDSLGSMLGLYFGLRRLGKKCRLVSGDPPLDNLSWPGLELIEYIPNGFHPGESCVIVLDCEPERTGRLARGVLAAKRLVNIDHHRRGRGRGDIVYVDHEEAATCVIVYRLLGQLSVPLTQEIATVLYGGILGDTGGFRHANTTSEVLAIAAELLSFGLEPAVLATEIFSSHPLNYLRFLGHSLNKLKTALDGRLVWVSVSLADYGQFGVDPNRHDYLIDHIRSVDTAEIAIVLRETSAGEIRIGFRAKKADVSALARRFGGGGHRLASGATVAGDLGEITEAVVEAAAQYLLTGEVNGRHS